LARQIRHPRHEADRGGIDPAISVSETADETSIIVARLSSDGHGYVLEDASGKMSPIEWARRHVQRPVFLLI
jgi:phage terminase large subunit-like protein